MSDYLSKEIFKEIFPEKIVLTSKPKSFRTWFFAKANNSEFLQVEYEREHGQFRAGDALLQFERFVTSIPVGDVNKSHGSSAYNWGVYYTEILRKIVLEHDK